MLHRKSQRVKRNRKHNESATCTPNTQELSPEARAILSNLLRSNAVSQAAGLPLPNQHELITKLAEYHSRTGAVRCMACLAPTVENALTWAYNGDEMHLIVTCLKCHPLLMTDQLSDAQRANLASYAGVTL